MLIATQLLHLFPNFHVTQKFITVSTSLFHSLLWARWNFCILLHHIYVRWIVVLSFLCVGLHSGLSLLPSYPKCVSISLVYHKFYRLHTFHNWTLRDSLKSSNCEVTQELLLWDVKPAASFRAERGDNSFLELVHTCVSQKTRSS